MTSFSREKINVNGNTRLLIMRENKRKFDPDLSWSIYDTEANETLTYGSIMANGFFSVEYRSYSNWRTFLF